MAPNPSHPALRQLDVLVGEWQLEMGAGGTTMVRGRSTFEWIDDGAFLVQRSDTEPTEDAPAEWVENAPRHTSAVIGMDDSDEQFQMLYADSRGVFRIYQLTFADGVLKIWRDAPGFSQRFTGTLSADESTLAGYWELAREENDWQRDVEMTYTR